MTVSPPIYLIINADDYGYFPCVSKGILAAARSGGISATGILANCPSLKDELSILDGLKDIDFGVHLNLTAGKPLTSNLTDKLSLWNGNFPNANQLVKLLLNGAISVSDIRMEWQAQIEVCLDRKLSFLNSHEHVHMLPSLFPIISDLARDYQIPHVRFTQSEWLLPLPVDALKRNLLIQGMATLNLLQPKQRQVIPFLGLAHSGKLNMEYFRKRLASLKPGHVYELMCHPGYFDPAQITEHRLGSYHDWEGELNLLSSPELHHLYKQHNIRLTRYHELQN